MKRGSLDKKELTNLYICERKSCSEIAKYYKCSEGKVNYWLKKFLIKKRSLSDALYVKHNPKGNPFQIKNEKIDIYSFIFGLGIGLYWGEGNKANKFSVRLGNTDPRLIKEFINFLYVVFSIKKEKLKFGLQVFSDNNTGRAKAFWRKSLNINDSQFQNVVVSKKRGIGTYTKKTKNGVLTVYFNNTKLLAHIKKLIEKIDLIVYNPPDHKPM